MKERVCKYEGCITRVGSYKPKRDKYCYVHERTIRLQNVDRWVYNRAYHDKKLKK